MRPDDEGITYLPGEITTPHEGYRELANVIVAQAADDYVTYLIKPNFDKEASALEEPAKEAVAMKRVIRYMEDTNGMIEAVIKLFLEVTDKAKKTQYISRGTIKQVDEVEGWLREAKTLSDLRRIASFYCKFWKDRRWVYRDRNIKRKELGEDCVNFFYSDQFYMFTSGKIDPELLMERCKREADRLRGIRGVEDDGTFKGY